MLNKITISAALLLAAAIFATSATSPRASTTDGAVATVCSELQPLRQGGRCNSGPHCQYFNISDRSVGPTFPTSCREIT
jgi:hypothetical protein